MFNKVFFSISLVVFLSACSSVQTTAKTEKAQVIPAASLNVERDIAPCRNGFDEVNVCQLLS
ncbi:hypothetical protein F7P73_00380 [Acinetobacter bohemicus]|jgi:hypothetical protein|uniref:Lipoprotein n=1 Tax=Acinetobacter bohemicus TaxID=1435036 RepID=A0A1I6NRC0_9GAMM|nr:hypothetical protein [Acinetobacter bohemicus]KAB0655003.1 hypothetical protein F7P73_00380 [Acinetobacter bohemicus]SFS30445.1 hypothetical protein SAMN05444586_100179 [Acinetobacter bohemicus]